MRQGCLSSALRAKSPTVLEIDCAADATRPVDGNAQMACIVLLPDFSQCCHNPLLIARKNFAKTAPPHHSRSFINGHVMSIFLDDDPTMAVAQGVIGLQIEGTGKVSFRKIWLRNL
jgi:hypothetical protein